MFIDCIYFAGAVARTDNEFGQGNGPSVLTHVVCTGLEYRLLDCPTSSSSLCHISSNDAGVECVAGMQPLCYII